MNVPPLPPGPPGHPMTAAQFREWVQAIAEWSARLANEAGALEGQCRQLLDKMDPSRQHAAPTGRPAPRSYRPPGSGPRSRA